MANIEDDPTRVWINTHSTHPLPCGFSCRLEAFNDLRGMRESSKWPVACTEITWPVQVFSHALTRNNQARVPSVMGILWLWRVQRRGAERKSARSSATPPLRTDTVAQANLPLDQCSSRIARCHRPCASGSASRCVGRQSWQVGGELGPPLAPQLTAELRPGFALPSHSHVAVCSRWISCNVCIVRSRYFTKLKLPPSPKYKTNPCHFLFARSLFVPPFEHSSKAKTTNEVGGKALP